MFNAILVAMLLSHGHAAKQAAELVILEGRPGCSAHALYGDPTRPVIVCDK